MSVLGMLEPANTLVGSPRKRGRLRVAFTPSSVELTLSEGRYWKLPLKPMLSDSQPWKMCLCYQLICGVIPMSADEL